MYPLHLAAKYNSLEAAKLLMQCNATVLCRDCKQKTPLHHAARKGHQQMLEVSIYTVQSLYNAMVGIHLNRPCYM